MRVRQATTEEIAAWCAANPRMAALRIENLVNTVLASSRELAALRVREAARAAEGMRAG